MQKLQTSYLNIFEAILSLNVNKTSLTSIDIGKIALLSRGGGINAINNKSEV